jgi:DmsE family decaheme c-type cytochrome
MRRSILLPILAIAVLLASALALFSAETGGKKAAAEKSKPAADQTKKYTRPTDPALYVGSETCKTCHEDIYKNFEGTAHFVTRMEGKFAAHKGPEWQGCEACHGPGSEHVNGGGDKTKISTFKNVTAQESSARCLDCHQYGEEHSNFLRSEHLKNNVGCVDCHSPHHAGVERALLKKGQPQLCYNCHLDVKPQFSRPFHHRVNEGLIACSDCHNPHGGFLSWQLRSTAAQDVVCYNCHADKAGPFAFEHAAVKTEGCVACHTPHGSANPRLLKRSQINLLCLECHTLTVDSAAPAIPSFHNQAQKYQACTLCHIAVHGSNSDRFLFKP